MSVAAERAGAGQDAFVALRFSEHGASRRHGGARAAWGCIGLYPWNGRGLVSNAVEQDYTARAARLESGRSLASAA